MSECETPEPRETTTPTSDEVRIRYELAVDGHWDSQANAEWAISSSLADIPMLLARLSAQAKELEGMRKIVNAANALWNTAKEENAITAWPVSYANTGRAMFRLCDALSRSALKEKP